jgi:hypothetical protein
MGVVEGVITALVLGTTLRVICGDNVLFGRGNMEMVTGVQIHAQLTLGTIAAVGS